MDMSTIQERLQIKRVPLDKWSIREQLCLASAVARSGDQNWSSVSRSLKPFAEPNRPPDWFSQKNCAAQYGSLLENVETPKRKKRLSGQLENVVETPTECILRKLIQERKVELKKKIEEERAEYFKLKEEINTIKQGTASDIIIDRMCQEIESEKKLKEQEALAHSEWLKNREERKLELERVFRPMGKAPQLIIPSSQKRKASESIENIIGIESNEESSSEISKPATSPLLTSLLKTPSNIPQNFLQNLNRVTSPTIASLLSSNTSVPVSPGLQQLVSTAINQETPQNKIILENNPLPNVFKIESVIKQEINDEIIQNCDPTPDENDKIDEILSEVKCNIDAGTEIVTKIVSDDENSVKTEPEIKLEVENASPVEKNVPEHDIYDFDESSKMEDGGKTESLDMILKSVSEKPIDVKSEVIKFLEKKKEKENQPGSVEIVEVVVMEDEDSDKETKNSLEVSDKEKDITEAIFAQEIKQELNVKEESNIDIEQENSISLTPDYTEAFFDMEVTKLDKFGKAKRDYSRTKKKEEKDIDILLAVEKAVAVEDDLIEETGSEIDSQDSDKKSDTSIKKLKEERSNSPWTEDDISFLKSKRRYSTPIDSVPSSPASSTNYDDDRDYKAWKKSVLFVYSRLAAHRYASLFLKPITDEQAPDYHSIIYRPMDLQTIRKNLENGTIRTTTDFHRDVLLMFNNAIMYNKSNTHVYNMAKKMQFEGLQEIQLLFQVQTPIEAPLRRETRTSESGIKRKRVQEDFVRNKKRRDE